MSDLPHSLQNGPGNYVDHNKYMDNWLWLYAIINGNVLTNGGMEDWNTATSFVNPADGATLADGWTLAKSGTSAASADVSRESTTIDKGSYSMKVNITAAGSSDSLLKIVQAISPFTNFKTFTLLFRARVKLGTASKVRVSITDGVTTEYSDYHTGDGTWQSLSATISCSSSMSALSAKIEITSDFGSDPVYIDSAFVYVIDPTMSQDARDALIFLAPKERNSFRLNFLDLIPQTSAPTAVAGRVYFDSTNGQGWIYDGTNWTLIN